MRTCRRSFTTSRRTRPDLDAQRLRAWVAEQIERHAPGPDVAKTTRLLDSARVLRGELWSYQVFSSEDTGSLQQMVKTAIVAERLEAV